VSRMQKQKDVGATPLLSCRPVGRVAPGASGSSDATAPLCSGEEADRHLSPAGAKAEAPAADLNPPGGGDGPSLMINRLTRAARAHVPLVITLLDGQSIRGHIVTIEISYLVIRSGKATTIIALDSVADLARVDGRPWSPRVRGKGESP